MGAGNVAQSTVGKKYFMAVSGLSLILFVIIHLSGNLLILVGAEPFNKYSHFLISNPLIYVAELGLISIFLLHFFLALTLTYLNKSARPVAYEMMASKGGKSRRTMASKSMAISGILLMVFLVYHVATLKYGAEYATQIAGVEMRDIYKLVVENFSNPAIVGLYVVMMVALGFHISHGISSLFQSLGWSHSKISCKLILAGRILAVIIAVGFSSLPIFIYTSGGGK